MKQTISKIKKSIKKSLANIDSPYKERLEVFSEKYKKLTEEYGVDFTMMPIDLKTIEVGSDGVARIKQDKSKN